MEGAASSLWTSITENVTQLVTLMGTMSTALLKNEIFVIVISVVMFGIGMGVVYSLVKKLRKRGK